MTFWKGICTCVGCVASIGVCIASAGMATPFIAASAAPWIIGGSAVGGYLLGNKIDEEVIKDEERLMNNQRYKDAKDALDQQKRENNQNKSLIQEIVGKINGEIPRQPHETDKYLNDLLTITQNNLRNGEETFNRLVDDLTKLRRELAGKGSLFTLLGLDKLDFMDKVMIAGGIALVIILIKD